MTKPNLWDIFEQRPKVDLIKRAWLLEVALDHRFSDEEADKLFDAIAKLVHDKRWTRDVYFGGSKRDIAEVF